MIFFSGWVNFFKQIFFLLFFSRCFFVSENGDHDWLLLTTSKKNKIFFLRQAASFSLSLPCLFSILLSLATHNTHPRSIFFFSKYHKKRRPRAPKILLKRLTPTQMRKNSQPLWGKFFEFWKKFFFWCWNRGFFPPPPNSRSSLHNINI